MLVHDCLVLLGVLACATSVPTMSTLPWIALLIFTIDSAARGLDSNNRVSLVASAMVMYFVSAMSFNMPRVLDAARDSVMPNFDELIQVKYSILASKKATSGDEACISPNDVLGNPRATPVEEKRLRTKITNCNTRSHQYEACTIMSNVWQTRSPHIVRVRPNGSTMPNFEPTDEKRAKLIGTIWYGFGTGTKIVPKAYQPCKIQCFQGVPMSPPKILGTVLVRFWYGGGFW